MAELKYLIGDAIDKPAKHHESFRALWETKWKPLCVKGVYPFMFGSINDFEPIAQDIIKVGLREPYDWNQYASMFFPKAEELSRKAEIAKNAGEKDKAAEYYLRSSAVYRIARFPVPRSTKQHEAWYRGKEVFYKGQSLLPNPVTEVLIPHGHRNSKDGAIIPASYLLPPPATTGIPAPLLLIVTGLDGYRTELGVWQEGFRVRGVATLVVEIPGTGDSPADKQDPTSPDRQWSSVLDWIRTQSELDEKRVIAWGFSTGGYYTLRMAHTHHDRLLGCISLGGGAHHMFDARWLRRVNKLEYPFDLATTLAYKFGYGHDLESFIREAGKYSLIHDGTLDEKPCTQRLLLVNGTDDEIFPIEDLYIALEHGSSKESRLIRGKKHMGEPESFVIVLRWIHNLLGLADDVMDQLQALPTKTKY